MPGEPPIHEPQSRRPWRLLTADHSLNELVLPRSALDGLRTLVAHVPEGRGAGIDAKQSEAVIALFCGEAGTGKSMAAQIVAAELGAPVIEVDTPSALARGIAGFAAAMWAVFQEGQRMNAVLVFDDAGAYLAPDGGRKHAGSRMEPVDLPARCASYSGLVIICSRSRPAAEPPPGRRFSAVIEFPFPDEAAREELWRRSLPADANLSPDELAFVARSFRLSPAVIQLLAGTAQRLAREQGQLPARAHLASALGSHYQHALASRATQAALAQLVSDGRLDALAPSSAPEPTTPSPGAGSSLGDRLRWSRRGREV